MKQRGNRCIYSSTGWGLLLFCESLTAARGYALGDDDERGCQQQGMDDITRANKADGKDCNATQKDVPLVFLGVGTEFIYEMT